MAKAIAWLEALRDAEHEWRRCTGYIGGDEYERAIRNVLGLVKGAYIDNALAATRASGCSVAGALTGPLSPTPAVVTVDQDTET